MAFLIVFHHESESGAWLISTYLSAWAAPADSSSASANVLRMDFNGDAVMGSSARAGWEPSSACVKVAHSRLFDRALQGRSPQAEMRPFQRTVTDAVGDATSQPPPSDL